MYATDDLKHKAILSKDQDSDGFFVYSLKSLETFCRPSCQAHEASKLKSDYIFFDSAEAATSSNLKPCATCNPDLPVKIDNSIIQHTVNTVNASLNIDTLDSVSLSSCVIDDDQPERSLSPVFRHNRSTSLTNSNELDDSDDSNWSCPRRASIANGHIATASSTLEEISSKDRHRGEGDHARLVNEACMHIAAAAAAAAAQAVNSKEEDSAKKNSRSSKYSSADRTKQMFKTQRKKRRGGILGFKELAAKAGLSPWHFHRVFRSVTGLTPKAYGDACWDTVTSSISPSTLLAQSLNKPVDSISTASSSSKKNIRTRARLAKKESLKEISDEDKSEDENDVSILPKPSKKVSPPPQQKKLPPTPESIHTSQQSNFTPSKLESPHLGNVSNESPLSLDIYEEQEDEEDNKNFFGTLMDDNNDSTFSSHLMVTDDITIMSQPVYSTQSADSNVTESTEDSLMCSWPMSNFIDSEMFPMQDAWVDRSSIDSEFMDDAFVQVMTTSQIQQLPVVESTRPRGRPQKSKMGLFDSLFENDTFMGGMSDPWNPNSPLPFNDPIDTVASLYT
jgi:methylphosphotriester-DNA--protein-cysteine methyltransferase